MPPGKPYKNDFESLIFKAGSKVSGLFYWVKDIKKEPEFYSDSFVSQCRDVVVKLKLLSYFLSWIAMLRWHSGRNPLLFLPAPG